MSDEKIDELLSRSIDTIYPSKEAFQKVLESGKKLRIYFGIDPTADYIHLGHSTNYIILKRFHELGHKIIILIGDFTAMIGDPSDKNAARKTLSRQQVEENLKSYKEQVGKILNFEDKENSVEVRFNSDWLAKLTFEDAVHLASHFTVQQMIERDVFRKRLTDKKPLFIHEFFYPLMQGYDSVALNADVEIGGTEQTFNMLAGRSLVRSYQKREKFVVTTTLLENPVTGEKLMSKSLGTGIGLNESARNMFGKVMTLPDEAIIQCFTDCTYLPMAQIREIEREMKSGSNPRQAKARLAFEVVKIYHGEQTAKIAQEDFDRTFRDKQMPETMEEVKASCAKLPVDQALVEFGLAQSKSQAQRLVEQGGVKIDSQVVKETSMEIEFLKPTVLQVGKLNFVKVLPHD